MRVTNNTSVPVKITGSNVPCTMIEPQNSATIEDSIVHNVYVVHSDIGMCQFVVYHGSSDEAYVSRRNLKSRVTVVERDSDFSSGSRVMCLEIVEF